MDRIYEGDGFQAVGAHRLVRDWRRFFARLMNQSNQSNIGDAATKSDRRDAFCIFGAACVVYLVLRSRLYIGDGVRYLPNVLGAAAPPDGGNGHFLWPYVLWLVARSCAAVGVLSLGPGPSRVGVVGVLQGVNAFAAAAGLVLLYRWLRRVASRRAALIGVALTGLSNAFLLHATDMTEPIAAVAPMMLGLCLVDSARDRVWVRFLAGGLIGLGAAFYQIALIAVAPAVWLVAQPR